MSTFSVLFGITLASGLAGLLVKLYISAFLLTTESIDSQQLGRRWFYRYFVFSFWYLLSFMLTPVLIHPLLRNTELTALVKQNNWIFFLLLVPLATLFYFGDRWLKRRFDSRKVEARLQLRKKFNARR